MLIGSGLILYTIESDITSLSRYIQPAYSFELTGDVPNFFIIFLCIYYIDFVCLQTKWNLYKIFHCSRNGI